MPEGRRRHLARSSAINLVGLAAPLSAGLIAIPILLSALGTERFGVLALAWTVTSYFSVFDLGLGRALTNLVAARVGEEPGRRAPALAWTALGLMLGLGIVGAVALYALAPLLVERVLVIPPELWDESRRAFRVLAICIPFVVATAGFAGILTAFHRFGMLNAVRAPVGMMILLGPVLVLPLGANLVVVAWSLVVVRVAGLVAMALACRWLLPSPSATRGSAEESAGGGIGALFGFGAWVTVTNIVSPVLVYLDRFLVGSLISMTAVAYYATPYEIVTKAFIIPGALAGVLFPAFSWSASRDAVRMERLFRRGAKYMALILFPLMLVAIAFAHEGLGLWLGAEFAANSTRVLQWIALGVFVNCVGQVFFTLVQGAGRPDLTAKFHLLELPIYVGLLYVCIGRWGITGAAMAWTARVALDALLLLMVSGRILALPRRTVGRVGGSLALGVAALAVPMAFGGLGARAALALALLAVFAVIAWRVGLAEDERVRLLAVLP